METADSNPLVTVIIPVYNTEPYLRKCLDSVCGQTYGNLEIICVNDGSTDGSQSILEEYAARDARVKVLVQENAGQAVARNRALEIATGEWISCIDSDDWLDTKTYCDLLHGVPNDVDVVCFGIRAEGAVSDEEKANIDAFFQLHHNGVHEVTALHVIGSISTVANKLLRRSVLEQYGIRFPEGKKYEDAAFHYCMMGVARKVCYHPDMLCYHYYQREDSTMHVSYQKNPIAIDHLYVCDDIYQFLLRHGRVKKMHEPFVQFFCRTYYFCREYLPDDMLTGFYQEMCKRMKRWRLGFRRDLPFIQELRAMQMGRLERVFHHCHQDRDSYGICGINAVSIVHRANADVYYVLGHRLFSRHVNWANQGFKASK